jgi:nucleotide-binding universal stress UspA family protein
MFKTILVATDGSGTATRAVELAANIAQSTGATLIAVSAYQEAGDGNVLQAERAAGIEVAKGLLEDVRKHHGNDVNLEVDARPGEPADVILAIAKERNVDLIVTGDRGMGSASRRVLGSVPNTLSHHAPCHVLLAHTDDGATKALDINKVLVATDGSDTATKAVRAGFELADALEAKTLVLTVADQDQGQKVLDSTAKSLGREIDGRVVQGSVSDAIIETAASIGADLIVTGSKGMQGARRLLGSVPNSVSHHSPCSLLIAKTV